MPAEIRAGDRVLVGRDTAHVVAVFPKGSMSYLFPHVRIKWEADPGEVVVAWSRVKAK